MLSLISLLKNILFLAGYMGSGITFPPPLSREDEKKYLELSAKGDENARNKLIEHNLRLVSHIAKKYVKSGYDLDDLISVGSIGLIKAVSSFNPEKGVLATYASRCIENEILMLLRREQRRSSLEVSIEEPVGRDSDGNVVTIGDRLGGDPDEVQNEVYHLIFKENYKTALAELLNEREQLVITMRYNPDGLKPLTQREVAELLNVSRSYVSRIEKKALSKLAERFGSEG